MSEEINKIIDNLEGCIGMFDYLLTPIESNLLVSYIRELQQENKQLEDNWNKLKEWLVQLQKFKGINQQGFSWGVAQEVLDKMEEMAYKVGE